MHAVSGFTTAAPPIAGCASGYNDLGFPAERRTL